MLSQAVCHGKPVIRIMRWPVEVVLDMLGSGMTSEEIVSEHPELEADDFKTCLYYAKSSISGKPVLEVK